MERDDLISRTAAVRALASSNGDYLDAWERLEKIPAVDAAPVVHGRWIEVDEGDGDYTYDCSLCGGKWWLAAGTPEVNGMKYCPYCGAKMDDERRDGDGGQA